MKRLTLNVLALLVISGGTAHLYADEGPACCTSASGQTCCGRTCSATSTSCCADSGCKVQPT